MVNIPTFAASEVFLWCKIGGKTLRASEVKQFAPEKLPGTKRKGSSSKHIFSGAMF